MAAEMAGDGVKRALLRIMKVCHPTAPLKISCFVTFAVYLYTVCI